LAGFLALLYRVTSQAALVVGLPVAGRTRSELEPLIGMFVNTLALRLDASAELPAGELLARVREAVLAAHANAELPFEKLVEAMAPDRGTGVPPLVQAMFALDVPAAELSLPGATLARREVWSGGAKLDLDVTLADLGARLRGVTLYDRGLFDPATIARLHGGYLRLLAALAAAPACRLAELPLLGAAERHQLVAEWNDSDAGATGAAGAAAAGATFPELFAAQAARCPERVAVACGGERLTYGELARRAGLLAARIAARLAPGGLVALALPRGLDLLTAMLAAWRAGSAYLPLDLEQPAPRLARMLASSGAGLVLTAGGPAGAGGGAARALAGNPAGNLKAALDELPPAARPPLLAVAADALAEGGAGGAGGAGAGGALGAPAESRPQRRDGQGASPAPVTPQDLAYVIFTSGSTGTPKGAMLDHGGMLNHLLAKLDDLDLSAADRVAQNASQTFDVSIWQYLAALLAGGEVVVYPDAVTRDPVRMLAAADRDRITVLEVVPTVLRFLLDHCERERERGGAALPALAALRFLLATGEALAPELCRRWFALFPRVPMINAYGPTECSDDVTHLVIREPPAAAGSAVPLGRPLRNLRVWVLDRLLQPVPIGVAGEICAGGRGVGRGYLGDSVRTALAFVPDPFAAAPGSRLYRTGDLGRRLAGGGLEFRGRIDHQVKVRGLRIELGEIEAALRRHPLVRDAAALDFADAAGERWLIAWAAAEPGAEPGGAALRNHLAGLLPDAMVPRAVGVLPELPRTANGKTDREALRQRSAALLLASAPARERVPPRTALERELAALWLQALGPAGVREVGVTDDFFELGGSSLTGAVLINRLQERLGEALPVAAIFDAPTIERLARFLAERHPGAVAGLLGAHGEPAADGRPKAAGPAGPAACRRRGERPAGPLPASFAQQRLWFLDRLQPGSPLYAIPVAFWLEGELDRRALALALNEIVRRHEALRTTIQAVAGEAVQVIAPPPARSLRTLPLVDLAALPALPVDIARREAVALAHREAARPFDLAAGPLFRAALLRAGRRRHALLLNLHHVIADGWSLEVLYRELGALYAAFAAGAPQALPEPACQYADYAAWQRGWLTGEVFARQLAYWREALAGAPRLLELPSARPRPPVQRHRGGASSTMLPPPVAAALAALARRQGTTFFVTLLAAWKLLLYRHTGQEDLVVGTPVAGRHRRELEEMIGPCFNMLAVRTRLGGDPTFAELLARVRGATLGAYAHQDLPFERLVDELQPERNLAGNPLFQVVFLLVDAALAGPALAGLAVAPLPIARGTAKFDLALACEPAAGGALAAVVEYNRDLFDPADAARLGAALAAQLEAIAASAALPISALPSLTAAMRHQLLCEWNDTAVAADRGATLHGLVARQAARTPDALAAVFGGGAAATGLTYRQLAGAACRGAAALRARGAGPGSLVAVYMERCLDMVPALLAILEAGAAYVPLSTRLPPARIAYILEAMDIRHLVTHAPRQAEADSWRGATPLEHVLALDALVPLAVPGPAGELAAVSPAPLQQARPAADPDAVAYVIFTSGSTGVPKGVVVQHRPAAALV
ncbi:MAG: AMP-binding protein, partial [Acidobacteria bacterium]|nr:AMP-binding protein [Acidobacteriota bacterium]